MAIQTKNIHEHDSDDQVIHAGITRDALIYAWVSSFSSAVPLCMFIGLVRSCFQRSSMQSRTRSGKGPGDDACFGLVRILVYNIITDEPWPGFTVDQLRSHLGYALQLR